MISHTFTEAFTYRRVCKCINGFLDFHWILILIFQKINWVCVFMTCLYSWTFPWKHFIVEMIHHEIILWSLFFQFFCGFMLYIWCMQNKNSNNYSNKNKKMLVMHDLLYFQLFISTFIFEDVSIFAFSCFIYAHIILKHEITKSNGFSCILMDFLGLGLRI